MAIRRNRSGWALGLCLALMVAGCGGNGGGGGSSSAPTVAAPTGLAYGVNPATYTVGQAIAPNAPTHGGGPVETYSISPSLPSGLALDATTGVLTGTPSAAAPSFVYTVQARNAGGSTSAQLTLRVNDVPPSNLTYAVPSATYTVGVAIAPNSPTVSGGGDLYFGVTPTLPPGLSLDAVTGVLSGTPSSAAPRADYTVTVGNTGGTTTAVLSLAVNELPPVALSYAFPSATYTVGTAIAPNTPTHGGGAVSLYSVAPGLPQGLALDAATGVISGTPTLPAAQATYRVTAANSAGSTTCDLALTVASATVGKAWHAQVPLSSPDAFSPALAVNAAGEAFAVWSQMAQSNTRQLWACRFVPAGGWAAPELLLSETGELAQFPKVAVDDAGRARVLWGQGNWVANTYKIRSRDFDPATGWGAIVDLETGGKGLWTTVDLAMDATGRGLGVWRQVDAVHGRLHTAPFSPGGWGAVTEVALDSVNFDLAMNATGEGWLLAGIPDTDLSSIQAYPISGGSAVGAGTLLEQDTGGGWDTLPSVAVDASGRALVAWQRYSSATFRFDLRASRYLPGSGWSAPQLIESNDLGHASGVRVALDGAGNGLAAWVQADNGSGGHQVIWANRFSFTSGWGTAVQVEGSSRAGDSFPSQNPALAFSPDGTAHCIWQDMGGGLTGAAFDSALGWGAPVDLSIWTSWQASSPPRLAFDGQGRAIALWCQAANTQQLGVVFASRFE